ncbi:MAG: aspartate/glutamate racemase family protein [Pseudomonadota bacterium]
MGLRILWQNVFTEEIPERGEEISVVWEGIKRMAEKVVRPDTEVIVSHLDRWSGSLTSHYLASINDLLIINKLIKAEKEGYDAAVVGCYDDCGVRQAREVMDMPVIGPCESSLAIAHLIGQKFVILTVAPQYIPTMERNVRLYGFGERLIKHRPVRHFDPWYWDALLEAFRGKPDKLVQDFEKEALNCVRDGADTIIVGCAPCSAALTLAGYVEVADTGVPVISAAATALKMAETMADIRKNIGPVKTRCVTGPYQTTSRDLIDKALREFNLQ